MAIGRDISRLSGLGFCLRFVGLPDSWLQGFGAWEGMVGPHEVGKRCH